MNPKLTYFSTAIILSLFILVLAMFAGSALKEPQLFWLGTVAVIFCVNLVCYMLSRRAAKKKAK